MGDHGWKVLTGRHLSALEAISKLESDRADSAVAQGPPSPDRHYDVQSTYFPPEVPAAHDNTNPFASDNPFMNSSSGPDVNEFSPDPHQTVAPVPTATASSAPSGLAFNGGVQRSSCSISQQWNDFFTLYKMQSCMPFLLAAHGRCSLHQGVAACAPPSMPPKLVTFKLLPRSSCDAVHES